MVLVLFDRCWFIYLFICFNLKGVSLKGRYTFGNYSNFHGDEHWRAVDSTTHCGKRLPLK